MVVFAFCAPVLQSRAKAPIVHLLDEHVSCLGLFSAKGLHKDSVRQVRQGSSLSCLDLDGKPLMICPRSRS